MEKKPIVRRTIDGLLLDAERNITHMNLGR